MKTLIIIAITIVTIVLACELGKNGISSIVNEKTRIENTLGINE